MKDLFNPVKFWFNVYEIWVELFIETRALRNCHNTNKSRIDLIESALRKDGILS